MSHGFQPTALRTVTSTLIDETDPTGTLREPMYVGEHSLISIHVEHGAITGTLTLYASNKDDPGVANDDDWVDTGVSVANPDGSAGSEIVEKADAPWRWLMLKYVHGSGAGDLLAIATAKA